MTRQPLLRVARWSDARRIAELFRISSEGVADYVWRRLGGPHADPLAVGTARYGRDEGAFSYRNCIVAECDREVVGMAHAFVVPEAEETEREDDPVLRPFAELELPGSLYLAALAVLPAYRGHGLGTRLLEATHERSWLLGCDQVSLLCFEENAGALRLYRRRDYRLLDWRRLVPHPLIHAAGDVLLLAAPCRPMAAAA